MIAKLTRRRLAVGLGAVTLFLAACGPAATNTNNSATQNPNAVAGGTLVLGMWQPQSSFLNAGVIDSQTFAYLMDAPSAEGLLWYRSEDQTASAKSLADYWQPWLATEVPTTDNGDVSTTAGCNNDSAAKMCVTWKLRSGVKWHDGSTFSSHDVCDTFQFYWLKYKTNNPTALLSTSGWDHVTQCTEKDAQTAVIDYKAQYGPYLALGAGAMGILPASMLDKAFAANADITKMKFTADLSAGSGNSNAYKTPAGGATMDNFIDGTGPYVLQSFDPNGGITYVINKNYWNKDHQPHITTLKFNFIADLASEVTAIKSGTIDAAYDMRLYNLSGLLSAQSSGKLNVQTIPDSGAEKLDLNACGDKTFWVAGQSLCGSGAKSSPYLANKDVRHAIAMAINRQGIVDSQAAGKTTVPKDSFLYLGAEYLDSSDIPQTKYDSAGANALLDKDGFKYSASCDGGKYRAFSDGTCMTLTIATTSNNPSRVATEPLIAADLAKVGIKVATPFANKTPGGLFGSFSDGGVLYTHTFDLAMYTNTLSAPAEPDAFYTGYVGCYDATAGSSPTTLAGCSGSNGNNNNIPSALNNGNGQNDTGINVAELNQDMETARDSVDLTKRTQSYVAAEKILADEMPEVPLYRQVTVDAYSPALQGVLPNDIIWDYNTYDWWCTAGKCQAG